MHKQFEYSEVVEIIVKLVMKRIELMGTWERTVDNVSSHGTRGEAIGMSLEIWQLWQEVTPICLIVCTVIGVDV